MAKQSGKKPFGEKNVSPTSIFYVQHNLQDGHKQSSRLVEIDFMNTYQ